MDVQASHGTTTRLGLRRPKLKSGLARLRRGPAVVQLGLDPERAVLLTGVDGTLSRCLDRLDGSTDPIDLARALNLPRERVEALIDLLAGADLLEDAAVTAPGWPELPLPARDRLAPDLAALNLTLPGPDGGKEALGHRLAAAVEIRGGGRIGATLAALLTSAGIGRVRVVDEGRAVPADLAPGGLSADDLGLRRGRAATRRAAQHSPLPRPGVFPAPDLVVFADRLPGLGTGDDLVVAGIPHLVAALRDAEGLIGPLVLPHRSSCLQCHHLTRTERDRAWPELAAQLAVPGPRTGPVRPGDVVLATTVAGHAALQALAFLDTGTANTVDGTLHLRLPGGAIRRRSWRRHPGCACAWGRRRQQWEA